MAKRDIERALERKGARVVDLRWEWQPTPGENVPCWTLEINADDADTFGIPAFHVFENSAHALREIEDWEPYVEPVF